MGDPHKVIEKHLPNLRKFFKWYSLLKAQEGFLDYYGKRLSKKNRKKDRNTNENNISND